MPDLEELVARWHKLRAREQEARKAVKRAVVAEYADGSTSTRGLATRVGVDRQTILGWLGKRPTTKPAAAPREVPEQGQASEPFEEAP